MSNTITRRDDCRMPCINIDEIRKQIKNRKGCKIFKKDKDATIIRIYPLRTLKNDSKLFEVKI
jgi:hypothetical protein